SPLIVPRSINNAIPIRAKVGFKLPVGTVGNSFGLPVRYIFYVDVTGCIKSNFLTGRGSYQLPDHLSTKSLIKNLLFKTQGFRNALFYIYVKWDLLIHLRNDIYFPDLPFGIKNDGLVIRQPVEVGVNAKNGPGFLLIPGKVLVNREFFAGFQVL